MTNAQSTLCKAIIKYRQPFDEKSIADLPKFTIQLTVGGTRIPYDVPKWSGPSADGNMEIFWGPWVNAFEDLADAAGWTPAERYPMTVQCLSGKARDKYREIINDPNGAHMPANNANRTLPHWWESIRDLSTELATSTVTWLGDEVHRIMLEWTRPGNYFNLYSSKDQVYPDSFMDILARLRKILTYTGDNPGVLHRNGQMPDAAALTNALWSVAPTSYKNYIITTRGLQPFAAGGVWPPEQLAEELDKLHESEDASARRQAGSKNGKGGYKRGGNRDFENQDGSRKKQKEDDIHDKYREGRDNNNQPCPFHQDRYGKSYHTYKRCHGNPSRFNASFKESVCKRILSRDDIKNFQWYIDDCKEHRNLEVSDGIKRDNYDRTSNNNNDNRDQQQQQQQQQSQQQQQQYHFQPPQLPLAPPAFPPFPSQLANGGNSYLAQQQFRQTTNADNSKWEYSNGRWTYTP